MSPKHTMGISNSKPSQTANSRNQPKDISALRGWESPKALSDSSDQEENDDACMSSPEMTVTWLASPPTRGLRSNSRIFSAEQLSLNQGRPK